MEYYASSGQHLLAELERIDLLIRAQVWRAQQLQAADELQGFYISEQEIRALLAQPAGLPGWAAEGSPLSLAEVRTVLAQLAAEIGRRKTESLKRGLTLRLETLARLFQLTPFDIDVLLICLAPELDLRYERFYAYLQDDVIKKRPSVDLVLNLLCPAFEVKLKARRRLLPAAPLRQHHLISLFDGPTQPHPPGLGRYLNADERIVNYLLESDELDDRLLPYAYHIIPQTRLESLLLPAATKRRLALLVRGEAGREKGLILYFQGGYGVGKQTTAEAICREAGLGLLALNGDRLLSAKDLSFETIVHLAGREARLQNAALYWAGFDALLADDREAWRETLLEVLDQQPGLTFLAGETTWEPVNALHDRPFIRIEFPHLAYAERLQLWRLSLNGHTPSEDKPDLSALASKFGFSGGQIRDAAATARNLARWRDPENGHITMADLYQASRLQSNRKLETLAQKIIPHYHWDDIVLPPDRLAQLREICNVVKYRTKVYDAWGFDRKLALGKGVNVLFAGPSGTGKTMAAEIIAAELGLDLYKIDLSLVVSKYIGETEKNLSRIFAEAEASNAILFFDEADALFGKRTEIRDAHDRYANVEISYLLQKMEEYKGVVILTTNLRKNMDDAFVRRMHFAVEFPFPSEANRRRIWRQIWPEETPRDPDLDLAFMARQFEIAGGAIRNIALTAAFLAADDGQVVDMGHLIRATRREYQKMGKVVAEDEFGAYARYARRR